MKWPAQMSWLLMLLSISACGDFEYRGKDAAYYFSDPVQAQLARAGARGSVNEIESLLRDGADLNYSGRDGFTVLYWTMLADQPNALKRLLALGADPNQRVFDNREPPLTTAAIYKNATYLEILLDHGVDIETTQGKSGTALHDAAKYGRLENVKLLVSRCANINRSVEGGTTAAAYGVAAGSYDVARYLLEQGSNYNLQQLYRYQVISGRPKDPTMQADYDAIEALLIENGIDVKGIAEGRVKQPNTLPDPTPAYGKDCKNPPSQ